jgi:alpha-mannosidase
MTNDFIWEGLDGTRVNTHWLPRGYSGISFPDTAEVLNILDLGLAGSKRDEIVNLCEEIRQYGSGEAVMVFNGGDFAYPQMSAPEIIREYNKADDGYAMRFTTLQNHLQSVPWHEMKVVRGEFNGSQQGTYTTNIGLKQAIRKLVNGLHSVERLSVALGRKPDCQQVWELILKQQFHDIICGSVCDGALLDAYNELRQAEKLLYEKKAEIESDTGTVAFFNPLGFERKEVVEADNNKYLASAGPFGFVSLDRLERITVKETLQLPYTFENGYYRAVIESSGYISSLVEKQTNTELVKKGRIPFGSIGMQVDYGDVWLNFEGPISGGSLESSLTQNNRDPYMRGTKDDIVNKATYPAGKIAARVIEFNDEQLIIEQTGMFKFWKIQFPVKTEITFQKSAREIRYRTSILPNGKNYRLRAAFPTSIEKGVIRHEIPFGIQERDQAEYPCQNWMDYQGDAAGLAVLNRGIPGNNVDEGIMMLTLFRSVAMEYKTESYLSYNQGVPHEFDYAVLPHKAGSDADIIRTAMAFNQPLVLCSADESAIDAGNVFFVDRENVFISGLRWQDDSTVFLRIYEGTGKHTKCRVILPQNFTKVAEADGIQRARTGFSPCERVMEIDIRPFEVRNFLFRCANP